MASAAPLSRCVLLPLRLRTPDSPSPQPPVSYTPKHLAERILAEREALEARATPDGERKTITALFADIKGSMDLLEDLDPEEARHIVDPALQLMMDAVHRYEGYVVQSTGDGIFALFGAPIAHEDHPLWSAPLAAAYGRAGRPEEGLSVLAEALAMTDETGARLHEAELYRVKGELTLAQSSVQRLVSSVQKEVEECFLK